MSCRGNRGRLTRGKGLLRLVQLMGERGFIFGGLLNKKNKRRLLTQTEKKKRIKKRKRKQSREGLTLPR
jgi:hypothetical protein